MTDHRIGLTIHRLPEVLAGALDHVIEPLLLEELNDFSPRRPKVGCDDRSRTYRVDCAVMETEHARWLVKVAVSADRVDDVLDEEVTERMVAHLDAMIGRYRSGEPLQYVLGRWAFRHLDLFVDERVLIPRRKPKRLPALPLSSQGRWKGANRDRSGTGSAIGCRYH